MAFAYYAEGHPVDRDEFIDTLNVTAGRNDMASVVAAVEHVLATTNHRVIIDLGGEGELIQFTIKGKA